MHAYTDARCTSGKVEYEFRSGLQDDPVSGYSALSAPCILRAHARVARALRIPG